MSTRIVELRCPEGPRRLLSKLLIDGGRPKIVEGNLIELSCPDCKRRLRQEGQSIVRVLHRFNLAGDLVESSTVDDG